ncbi:hypothetical protein [Sphingomonas solaris]|uniref:Bacteriophage tail tape measure N-terminal domain-containing protein n=1 Tax=Alterirhizorhabdus solaris TaxID=2529389 RepID=A0A558R824_9SPHN|nr:hypothetical protein [Sphingomonas solaris]TVV75545.1 hypothetical protein FOY91_06705 [Sphingomonas solaris]
MPSVDIVARLKLAGEQFSSEFTQRMDRIEKEATTASARVSGAFEKLKGLGGITVAGLGVAAFAAAAQRALDYASSLGETSQQLGVTTRDLQVYRYAATQVGLGQEEMDKSLAKLTVQLGKASLGAEKPSKAFAALGVEVRDASGHVKTAGQAIPELADAISKIEDPARRAALEVELFGKTGQKLDTLLAGGSAQISELAANAARLGLVLSDSVIAQADEAADKISEMRQVLDAQFANAIAQNAGALVLLADAATRVATSMPEAIRQATGLARVLQNEGIVGYLRSDKARLDQASTPRGYAQAKISDYRDAADDYNRAKAGGGSQPAVDARLARARKLRADAIAAVAIADAQDRAAAAPKPTPAGDGIDSFLAGASPKPKSAGKSDAQREAEQRAKDGERASKALDEQIAKADDLARIEQTRLQYGDREADAQEAVARVRDQNRDIVERTVPQLQAAYGWTEQQARAALDTVRALEDQAELTSKQATDAKALAASAQERAKVEEDAARETERLQDEQRRRQEETVRGLADFYRDAFEGGSGSIWKTFKQMGLDAISEIAARYTLALLSGKSTDLGSIVSSASGTGSPLGSLIGGLGSIGGLLKGGSSAAGGINNVAQTLGIASSGGTAAAGSGLLGGLGGAGSALSAAAPYLAVAAVALPVISGLLKSTKKGSATIGFTGGDLGVTSTTGSSARFKAAADTAAGSVIAGLQNIADQLGGTLSGSPSVSIGVRHGDYRVDTSGSGKTKIKSGAIDFNDDQEAAVKYAIADALKDGVLTGVSAATKRLLAGDGDIDEQLAKAVQLESIPKLLKARLDPVGAAVDTVNDKFAAMVKVLDEAGASAEQRADAEKLYRLELDEAKASAKSAAASLEEFLSGLNAGSGSTLSLRDQEASAKAALDPYLAKIDAGVSIDQQAYLAAAQTFLGVERELHGSTQAFFDAQAAIQAATGKAISTIENATPISGSSADPFVKATAAAAEKTAAAAQTGNEIADTQTDLLRRIVEALESGGSGAGVSAFFADARGYA